MKNLYLLLWFIGGIFVFLFCLWYLIPTDSFMNLYIGETASAVFLASGITCFYVGYHIRREIVELTEELRKQAKEEADAAVRTHICELESDLKAARDYISRMT